MSARRWTALLWTLSGAVVLLLLLKFFVADVYRVDSGSMRPTLFGGRERPDGDEDAERVLVLYGRAPPSRFDLVVIRSPDGSKPLVKRVCGVPGDRDLMIRGGDLFIGRERLPPEAPRPAPVPVYDDRYQDPEQLFEFRRDGTVRRDGLEWLVVGGAEAPGNLLKFHPELRDDYLDRRQRRVPGVVEVNDAELELEFALDEPGAGSRLRLQLTEENDLFEVELEPRPGGATLRLLRSRRFPLPPEPAVDGEDPRRELARAEVTVALAAGAFYDLRFSNIDNYLRVRSRALSLDLGSAYEQNAPLLEPGATGPGGEVAHNLGARVLFGIQGGRARFRAVRVLRDLYYTQAGRFGVRGPGQGPAGGFDGSTTADDAVSLGPDDYFLLGDNSSASTDSRHFGTRKASELLGRPLAVVWPAPRWLPSTREP